MTKWMETAQSQLGIAETPGPEATAAIVGYFRDAGHPEAVSDEIAWCAAFVGACLKRSGIEPSGSLAARSYLTFGKPLPEPIVGAIAVFSRADPVHGHVGFVTGVTADAILLLGGNQSNRVSVTSMPRDRLLGCVWPDGKPPGAATVEHAVDRATNSLSVRGFIGAGLAGIASLWSPALDALAKAAAEASGVYQHLATLHLSSSKIAAGVGVVCLGVAFVRQFLPRSTP